jgi:two-component system phosphate regulon sensor histidine kinase PhoR
VKIFSVLSGLWISMLPNYVRALKMALLKLCVDGGIDLSVELRPDKWFDDLVEGVVLVKEGRVTSLNRAARELLDVEEGVAVGVPLIAVLRDHRLEEAYTERQPVEVQTRGRILRATPILNGLSLLDVTEIRASQESARELLAVLSHELRTPTTSIRAVLETLQLEIDSDRRIRFLNLASEECERLVRLIEDLTVEVKPPRERRLKLEDVLGRARVVAGSTLEKYGVNLDLFVSDLTVWADEDKLLQVAINLIENAAIHGPDFASIQVRAEIDRRDQGFARVSVHDSGNQLDSSRLADLFQPHTRGPSSKVRGTGLGLYIVRSITEAWGGKVWVETNVEGGGNIFGFTVPKEGSGENSGRQVNRHRTETILG